MTTAAVDPTDPTAELATAARAAVDALADDPGIPTHLSRSGDQLTWHIDHAYLDARPAAEVARLAWAAMTVLTGHGVAWTHPDIDGAHRILSAGGALVLAPDTEDGPGARPGPAMSARCATLITTETARQEPRSE